MVTETLERTLITRIDGLGPKLLNHLIIAIERAELFDAHEFETSTRGSALPETKEADCFFLKRLLELSTADEANAFYLSEYTSHPPEELILPDKVASMDPSEVRVAIGALRSNSDKNSEIIERALAELKNPEEP